MFKKLLCILAALFAAQSACACGFDSMLPLSAEAHPHSPSNTTSSWGGSVAFDAKRKRWVMFAAEIAESCGLNEWYLLSRMWVRAVLH